MKRSRGCRSFASLAHFSEIARDAGPTGQACCARDPLPAPPRAGAVVVVLSARMKADLAAYGPLTGRCG